MMVSLLLFYARGERSSRGVERKCVEDVAYRVIAAQQTPGNVMIAGFGARYEDALAGLFSGVLWLCKQVGLVRVGVIAIEGTKVHASAFHHCNLDYELLAREILKEAAALDAAEDELYGDTRGDELPEHLRTSEGTLCCSGGGKSKIRARPLENGSPKSEALLERRGSAAKIELDAEAFVARAQGREGWLLVACRQLDEPRRRWAAPIARLCAGAAVGVRARVAARPRGRARSERGV